MLKSKTMLLILSRLFLVMVMLGSMSACKKDPVSSTITSVWTPLPVIPDSSNYKSYLALGDSYTIGQSVNADQRFPMQAAELLTQQSVQMKLPEIIATTGWTTGNLISTLFNNSPVKTYDFVSLLIGVNNQYQRRSPDEYRIEFANLLNKAILYAGNRKNRVFVLSIPDYSVTPFAQNSDTARIAMEIDIFNSINKEITLANGVAYLDITPISREARTDVSLIASDGLHPSSKQYQRWAALLAPMMKAAL